MSRATVIDFPRRPARQGAPDYRLPNAAYYAALEVAELLEDLAFRIDGARPLGRTGRRRLAQRVDAIADKLYLALGTTELLP